VLGSYVCGWLAWAYLAGVGVRAQDGDGGSDSERAERARRLRHAAHRARVENQSVRIIGSCRGGSMGPAGLFDGFDGWCRVGS
jgi:hypothetical protein